MSNWSDGQETEYGNTAPGQAGTVTSPGKWHFADKPRSTELILLGRFWNTCSDGQWFCMGSSCIHINEGPMGVDDQEILPFDFTCFC